MKRVFLISFLAAMVLTANIGFCGECDFYNDFGTPLIAPITSNGVIAGFVHSDEAEPLPAGVKLRRIYYNKIYSNIYPYPSRVFLYDDYGRVRKILVYEPSLKKNMVEKAYYYKSTAPDSFIRKVVEYDPKTGEVTSIDEYVYETKSGIRKLKLIKHSPPDKTSWEEIQPDYNPFVFTNSIVGLRYDYAYTRDAQNHVTSSIVTKVHTYFVVPGAFFQLRYPIIYKYNANGKLIRTGDAGIRTLYKRNSFGLLTSIKNKGDYTYCWFFYSN
ncbi:MAG: hypothetical protein AB9866_23570 [Syntrophobacteraceae bacterium]